VSASAGSIRAGAHAARVNLVAVVVAGLVAFGFSLVWYSPFLFGGIWAGASGTEAVSVPAWKFAIAPLRELISAYVLTWLIVHLGITRWKGAAGLGLTLWFAFYVVQLAGAVIWDGMPPALGAVHAGDWLGKMLIMALIVNAWRTPRTAAA
jgi:hypothetical protein